MTKKDADRMLAAMWTMKNICEKEQEKSNRCQNCPAEGCIERDLPHTPNAHQAPCKWELKPRLADW